MSKRTQINIFPRGKKGLLYASFYNPNYGNGYPKQILWSTGTSNRVIAREKGNMFYQEVLGVHGIEKRTPRKNEYATIEDLLKCYEEFAPKRSHISRKTMRANSNTLITMLSRLFLHDEIKQSEMQDPEEKKKSRERIRKAVLNMRCDVLKPDLWEKYNEWHYNNRGISEDIAVSAHYSINSEASHILAVISRYMIPIYKKELNVPNIEEFRIRKTLPQKETEFRRIPDDIDTSLRDSVLGLIGNNKKASDGKIYNGNAIFVAFELARFCGMRADEIANARWDWLKWSEDQNCYFIRVGVQEELIDGQSWRPKNYRRINARLIPVKTERVSHWASVLGIKENDPGVSREYIIPGTTTRRKDTIRRGLCEVLSPLLPGRTKRAHELRKQYGSDIYLQTKDIVKAARLLGDTVETTTKHYIDTDSSVVLL